MTYLDHASTTYLLPEVEKAMKPFWQKRFGNPSSFHQSGRDAKKGLVNARETVASVLNCQPEEIIFTGSGTESDNLALIGIARANSSYGKHIITTQIEHHAVLHSAQFLEKQGFKVTYLPVDKYGLVSSKDLKAAIKDHTILVSIMYANNEIGTIEPIREFVQLIKNTPSTPLKRGAKRNILFHTDACQAAGALSLDVQELGVDLLTINGSKIYGPKGIGALYVRNGIKIEPIIFGGAQESKLRAGTENIAGIVGLAEALKLAQKARESESARLIRLRDKLTQGILKIKNSRLNGHPKKRLPNNVNVSIYGVEGESLLLYLDQKGICVSTGSACTSASLDPSHVLLAIGVSEEYAQSSLRLTLGKCNTAKDVDFVLKILPECVEKLRKVSGMQ